MTNGLSDTGSHRKHSPVCFFLLWCFFDFILDPYCSVQIVVPPLSVCAQNRHIMYTTECHACVAPTYRYSCCITPADHVVLRRQIEVTPSQGEAFCMSGEYLPFGVAPPEPVLCTCLPEAALVFYRAPSATGTRQ